MERWALFTAMSLAIEAMLAGWNPKRQISYWFSALADKLHGRDAPTPKSFWSYQAPDTPSLESSSSQGANRG